MQTIIKLEQTTNNLIKEFNSLNSLIAYFYSKVWIVEQEFNKYCVTHKDFVKEFPTFYKYIMHKIPTFSYRIYLLYKPLIISDNKGLIIKMNNEALNLLRCRVLLRHKGFKPNYEKVFDYIDKNKEIINIDDIEKACNDAGLISMKRKPGQAPKFKMALKYTKAELKLLTKNDLVELCLKFQKIFKSRKNNE